MNLSGVGSVLGGHRIDEVIGQGGMGIVYRATHLRLDREVALKVITPGLAGDPSFRERFKRESRTAASLRHPHIVTIFDAGEADNLLYITMEYVIGSDLQRLIRERGRMRPEAAVDMAEQIGSALTAAHSRGLVHRDVKPANVLIQGEQVGDRTHAYLTDFGLTRHASSVGGLTRTGQWVGTLDYVAPEQLEGKKVDGRADVYSLGCMLFEALTGTVPFDRENDLAKLWAHVHDPPPSLLERTPDVPPALDEVIAVALRKDRDERYETADDLAAAARGALSVGDAPDKPAPAPPTLPPEPKEDPPPAKEPAGETVLPAPDKPPTPRAPETVKPVPKPPTPPPPPAPESEDGSPPPPAKPTAGRPVPDAAEERGASNAKSPPTPYARRRLIAGAVVAFAVALGVGLILAPDGEETETGRATAGNLSLEQPAGWDRDLSGGREITGLSLSDVVAYDYGPSQGQSIIRAGALDDPGPTLDPIPAALADRFRKPPKPQLAEISGGGEGFLYEGEAEGGDTLQAMIVPTTRGYQAIACEGRTADFAQIAEACESTIAGARVVDAEPLPAAPDPQVASALAGILAKLGDAQAAAEDGLNSGQPGEQADAAASLSSAYADAAKALDDLKPPFAIEGAVADLSKAMTASSAGFADLEAAVRDENEGAFDDAQAAIGDASAQATDALGDLEKNGYTLDPKG